MANTSPSLQEAKKLELGQGESQRALPADSNPNLAHAKYFTVTFSRCIIKCLLFFLLHILLGYLKRFELLQLAPAARLQSDRITSQVSLGATSRASWHFGQYHKMIIESSCMIGALSPHVSFNQC